MFDIVVVAIFLGFTLTIGVRSGRRVASTMREFAVADNSCTTAALAATIVATCIGGGTIIGYVGKVFSSGVFYLVGVGYALGLLPLAYLFAKNFRKFSGMLSVGDIMASFYGSFGKKLAGVLGVIGNIGGVGAQLVAMGYILDIMFDIPQIFGLILSASIVVLYSAFGGIRAIIATDIVQFIVFVISVPIIFSIGMYLIGGYKELLQLVPQSHWQIIPKNLSHLQCLSLFLVWWLPYAVPEIILRFLSAKDGQQVISATKNAVIVMISLIVIVFLIGLIAVAIIPEADASVAMPTLINTILPAGVKGFVVAGLLAVFMSTADSCLHAAAISLVYDAFYVRNFSDKKLLFFVKISTVVIGIFAIIFALNFHYVLELAFVSYYIWAPVITVPLLAGMLGFRTNGNSFMAGAIAVLLVFAVWQMLDIESSTGLSVLLPGLLANIAGFFGSHYLFCTKQDLADASSSNEL